MLNDIMYVPTKNLSYSYKIVLTRMQIFQEGPKTNKLHYWKNQKFLKHFFICIL